MKIEVTRDDGTLVDITEGVQVLYDTATGSMDWGSGFLDHHEMVLMAEVGRACGFSDFQALLDSLEKARAHQERVQERADRARQDRLAAERRQAERLAAGSTTQAERMRQMVGAVRFDLTPGGLAIVQPEPLEGDQP